MITEDDVVSEASSNKTDRAAAESATTTSASATISACNNNNNNDEQGDVDYIECLNNDKAATKKKQPWKDDPFYKTCDNTPGKGKSKSDVWNYIKRPQLDHEKGDVNGRGRLLSLVPPNGKHYYTTTKAFMHVSREHEKFELDGQQISVKKQHRKF